MTQDLLADDRRWNAVLARDPHADFVYAVETTRVYCRPSCPSRRPRPENVRFFPVGAEAERCGFRACRRCRPDEAVHDPRTTRVETACRVLAATVGETPLLADLARTAGTTPDTLRRDFLRVLGITPKQYADALRVDRLRAELRDGRDVTGAAYTAGYGSSSRLYEQSDARLGMTPSSYGAGGAGARVTFTICASPLGKMLIATTERGVCRVNVGDRDLDLEVALREEFHAADVERDDDALATVVAEVLRRIDGAAPSTDVPIDVRGTAFQQRVWQELRRIPRGETRSYGEVAVAVGSPGAARAVGSACGSNPVAIVVPCHRVVASDGGLGGFGLGLPAKVLLLENEAALPERLSPELK